MQLMIDLSRLEQRGLTRVECDRVRQALEELAIAASAIPDKKLFGSSIRGKLIRFAEAYVAWNGHTGKDHATRMARRAALKRLGDRRQELAGVERRNWHILRSEIDLVIVNQIYGALGTIITAMPDLFANLAKSVSGITVALGPGTDGGSPKK
ncbi:MAG TPA: hypothetical protein VGX50_13535 [Longimicrobium sp.]|nr:hypothetical protein [Longimicrobium sp.]